MEYDSLVTSITARPDPIWANELYAHMLSHEINNSVQIVANAAFRGNRGAQGRGHGGNHGGERQQG